MYFTSEGSRLQVIHAIKEKFLEHMSCVVTGPATFQIFLSFLLIKAMAKYVHILIKFNK